MVSVSAERGGHKVVLDVDGMQAAGEIAAAREQEARVGGPLQEGHCIRVLCECLRQAHRSELLLERRGLPQLDLLSMSDGDVAPVGGELEVEDGLLEVEVGEDDAASKVNQQRTAVCDHQVERRTSLRVKA